MKEKTFQFHYVAFIVAFLVGLVYVYLNVPKPKVIIKYPTPYNSQKLTYMGLTGECFKFKAEEVDCSKDAYKQPIV